MPGAVGPHPLRPRTPGTRGLGRGALVVASLAVLLAAADTYVVVLALPEMMLGVGIGLDELQRAAPIVSLFLLGYVAVMPLIGRLGDLHGRTPVLVGCLLVFALGSLLTASAGDLPLAVAGRFLQGVGGGGLVPVTLAIVADLWPPERRGLPLGVVGAVQELGSVAGPLYGALVLALSGWRAIFWVNVVAALLLVLALAVVGARRPPDAARRAAGSHLLSVLLAVLAVAAAVLLVTAPAALVQDVTWGVAYVPRAGDAWWSSPLAVATLVLWVALLARGDVRRGLGRVATGVDIAGAVLLSLALGGVVLAFAAADPERQVVSDNGPLLLAGSLLAAVLFAVRQRRAAHPLVPRRTLGPRPAWGALLVNLFVGAALVAALVDVPVFARATAYPESQLGAALVLVRLLAALPVGALLGGWACRRYPPRAVSATGMGLAAVGFALMSRWDADALSSYSSTVALVVTGLGFGLAIAPVNVALLAAVPESTHGIASALSVVARTMGMLVGLSVLTAIGLRVFYAEQARIGSPLELCPDSPLDCPEYEEATREAVVSELGAIFLGAGVCAAVAAVLSLVLLRVAPAVRTETARLLVR